ncbi:RICIN domain-containing protein [Streptomyces sp. NPDC007861]|uniref:RICIN domain-containing protein n=1 Tax=Streptomyces sp. NPDC007861 TaxID=3154893 RepID=UPI0033E87537
MVLRRRPRDDLDPRRAAAEVGGTCADTVGGGTASGTKVHTWDCGSQDSQKWVWRPNGTLHVKSGRCLGIENQSTADGARLPLWDCGSQVSQGWSLAS